MDETRAVTVTLIHRPARKLIVRRGIHSTDYFSYCAEIGCDIWDVLEKIEGRLERVSFVLLPPPLIAAGTSKACCAAEVPLDYAGPIPAGCDEILLEAHPMLWFQGAPYEDEEQYGQAHAEVARAVASYQPERLGYRFAYDQAPEFHYGAPAKEGCRQLVPVTPLEKR